MSAEVVKPAGGAPVVAGKKKKSSRLGDSIFLAYNLFFAACIVGGYYRVFPEYEVERFSLAYSRTWSDWMGKNPEIPVVLSVLYVVLTFGGQKFMEKRSPMDLRLALALWSLFLAVFSFIGAVRTVPRVVEILQNRGVKHLICGDTRHEWLADDPAGSWTMIFCLSKIPELVDTAFIVLRKKELITLHWYHHFTVMLFCWQSWAACALPGLVFASVNLSVHASMYFFYALTALGYRPTTFAQSITAGQILQMIVGTGITMYVTYDKLVVHPVDKVDFGGNLPVWLLDPPNSRSDELECHMTAGNAIAGLGMYFSYLLLFLEFYYSAYIKPRAPGDKPKAE